MLATLTSHIIVGADGLGKHSKLMVECGVHTLSCASCRIPLNRIHISIKSYFLGPIKICRMTGNIYEWLRTANRPSLSLLALWRITIFSLKGILNTKFLTCFFSQCISAIAQMHHPGRFNSPVLRKYEDRLSTQVSFLRDLIASYEISLCVIEGFLSFVSIANTIQNRRNQNNICFALNMTIGFLSLLKCFFLFYPLLEALVEVLLFWLSILIRFA